MSRENCVQLCWISRWRKTADCCSSWFKIPLAGWTSNKINTRCIFNMKVLPCRADGVTLPYWFNFVFHRLSDILAVTNKFWRFCIRKNRFKKPSCFLIINCVILPNKLVQITNKLDILKRGQSISKSCQLIIIKSVFQEWNEIFLFNNYLYCNNNFYISLNQSCLPLAQGSLRPSIL